MDDRIFKHLGAKAIALVPRREPVAIISRWIDLDKTRHLWLKGRLALTRSTGSHRPEGTTVVAEITADELVFMWPIGLLVILASKFHRRFHRL